MAAYTASNPVEMTVLPTTNGVVQQFTVGTTNTGSSTFAPDGLAAAPIFGLGGAQLQGGEIVAGGIATLVSYLGALLNGGNLCWVLLGSTGGALQVASAMQSDQAINLGQAEADFAAINGAAGETFNVAEATESSEAVPLGQLALVKNLGFSSLTSSGNFTTPANINTSTVFAITLVGGGGGGGGVSEAVAVAGGGGAGGAVVFYIDGLSPSTSYAVVVGSGGAEGTEAGTDGGDGGTTQITVNETVYSVTGGFGGQGFTDTNGAALNNAQGTLSASITTLPNLQYFQTDSSPGTVVSDSYSGSNGAAFQFGTGGQAGRSGFGVGGAALGYGAGGGGGVGSSGGGAGAPGLFTAQWVA